MVYTLTFEEEQDISLIYSALKREESILQWEIDTIIRKLKHFEKLNNLENKIFFEKYNLGEMGDDDQIMEWAGEYQFYQRFLQRLERFGELLKECEKHLHQ